MATKESLDIHSRVENNFADSPMLIRSTGTNGFFRTNASFRDKVGFTDAELSSKPLLHWIDPADVDNLTETLEGKKDSCKVKHLMSCGSYLPLNLRSVEHDGDFVVIAEVADKTKKNSDPKDEDDEATVSGTLHTIARIVEEQNPGYKCSILLVADGRFVRGAGPSLPEEYNAAIDGFAIGPTVGSCGTAIYWNTPVIVEDIQADPLWVPFAELAKEAGVAACWSHPFVSTTGNVLGALAFYSPVPKAPTPEQLGRLKAAASMTGLAVERGRAEEALRKQRQRELELEEQLRQAAKMEALGVLAGGIAHDFNNILSTILSNAELARDIVDNDDNSELNEMLLDIIEASKRAGEFCLQMLAYAGRGTLMSSQIEIGALIPEASNLVQAAISKKTKLEYNLLKEDIYIKGDSNQLIQVIMNLITNAAEAIGDNEGRILISSKVKHYDDEELQYLSPQAELVPGEYVCLSVSDTGVGMDSETVSRIFDPFFTTKSTGHGLGLSAVVGIVNQHGGVIQIDSKVGKGTTFSVILPTVKEVQSSETEKTVPTPDVGRKRVLIAEDGESVLIVLSKVLKRAGFEVFTAADGQEAVDIFSENCDVIDCALIDLNMPKLNGEETMWALRELRNDLPIVMMSGFSEQELIDRFKDAGISGCLQKPVSNNVLLDKIKNALTEENKTN